MPPWKRPDIRHIGRLVLQNKSARPSEPGAFILKTERFRQSQLIGPVRKNCSISSIVWSLSPSAINAF